MLLALSIVVKKPTGRLGFKIVFIAVPVFFIYSGLFLVADYFTGEGINSAVIFHLRYGLSGAGFEEYFPLIGISILGVFLALLISRWIVKTTIPRLVFFEKMPGFVFWIFILLVFVIHPSTVGFVDTITGRVLFRATSEPSNFYDFYRFPGLGNQAGEKKNLVYIYLEGLEHTYFDEKIFPGLLPNLSKLESGGMSFTEIESVNGTAWTIGGLTATQCGIPLFTPSHGNSMSGMDRFLPNARCVGDLLSSEGYHLIYLNGSSLEFAGKGKLFETHGFEELVGLDVISKSNPDAKPHGWGFNDDVLFDFAFDRFEDLSRASNPFAMFMLTVDTHPPDGRLSQSCQGIEYKNGDNRMLNAVACTDLIVSRLVSRIQASEFARNTVVVISSDHLAMRNPATDLLETLDRRNLFLILDPDSSSGTNQRRGSLLDVAPTWLHSLGYKADLGLGRSLFHDDKTLVEVSEDASMALHYWREPISEFWGFPRLSGDDELSFDTKLKRVRISDRVFKYPLVIEVDDENETIFRFDSGYQERQLNDFVRSMAKNKIFIWVGSCQSMKPEMANNLNGDCVMYGNSATELRKIQEFSSESVLRFDRIQESVGPL
jgi:phosphoglycerol transferase